jgi:MFS family permease
MKPQHSSYTLYQRVSNVLGHPYVDTETLLDQKYTGRGTKESPFHVVFLPDDPQNAMTFPQWKKWLFTWLQALATLATTFASSAYSGGMKQVILSFNISTEVATLGISFYVLGFALGPLVWAPLSELYGRRRVFFLSFMAATVFSAGAAGAGSISALLIFRFLTGSIGSAPLSNAPGVIADMFDKSGRGMAMCMFSGAPFLGPAVGKNTIV